MTKREAKAQESLILNGIPRIGKLTKPLKLRLESDSSGQFDEFVLGDLFHIERLSSSDEPTTSFDVHIGDWHAAILIDAEGFVYLNSHSDEDDVDELTGRLAGEKK